ncbi:MAG: FAD-dependent oxidoreductase [Gemmatimonadetes bacterium]|nr:FAD-dependent oxidoreductase [Gemmatimonadota bacterium]MDA1102275.1 FAD-dependent oxidoreductase [Gemmatimonadota bacterium]
MPKTRSDVVVIGAGINGASSAFQLASRGLRVTVLERDSAPAMGSTGKSAAGVRVQFTTAPNIRLSLYSLPAYREFADRYGHDIGYKDIGYLLLVPHARWSRHLESVELQQSLGAPVEVFAPEDARRFIDFDTEGLAGATYGPWDGVIDPHMVTHAWVAMGKGLGVDYRMNRRVTAIERSGSGWEVSCGTERYSCGHIVNVAGAWSGEVGRLAGLDVPVGPKRIQIFMSAPITDTRTYPLTIDLATGVYVRSEGDRVLFGLDNLTQPFGFTEGVDEEWLEHVLLTGVGRFPWWEELGIDLRRSWWGYYGVSPDNSPIIGFHPDAQGWIDACGFSGHGIMHAPATGVAVAELVANGRTSTVDVDHFRHGRFGGDVAVEANIF